MNREGPSQSPRDRVLWMLSNSGGKMERSRLRRCAGMRYALLDPILLELARKGKIRVDGELITIIEGRFPLNFPWKKSSRDVAPTTSSLIDTMEVIRQIRQASSTIFRTKINLLCCPGILAWIPWSSKSSLY